MRVSRTILNTINSTRFFLLSICVLFRLLHFRVMHAHKLVLIEFILMVMLLAVKILAFPIMNWKPKFHFEHRQTEAELNYGTNIALHLYFSGRPTDISTKFPSREHKGLAMETRKQTENLFTLTSWEIRNTLSMSNDQWPGKLISVLYTRTRSLMRKQEQKFHHSFRRHGVGKRILARERHEWRTTGGSSSSNSMNAVLQLKFVTDGIQKLTIPTQFEYHNEFGWCLNRVGTPVCYILFHRTERRRRRADGYF